MVIEEYIQLCMWSPEITGTHLKNEWQSQMKTLFLKMFNSVSNVK